MFNSSLEFEIKSQMLILDFEKKNKKRKWVWFEQKSNDDRGEVFGKNIILTQSSIEF